MAASNVMGEQDVLWGFDQGRIYDLVALTKIMIIILLIIMMVIIIIFILTYTKSNSYSIKQKLFITIRILFYHKIFVLSLLRHLTMW